MPALDQLLQRESNLKQFHATTLVPFFRNAERIDFLARDKTKLVGFAFSVPRPVATVVLVPGRTESTYKYAELIYDLNAMGFSVFSIDHRGQGESQRIGRDASLGHVKKFSDYVDDLSDFVDQVVKPGLQAPLFFLSHSMGCAVTALYLMERSHPAIKGVVLSAPMFEINFGMFPPLAAKAIANITCAAGLTEGFVTGTGPVDVKTYGADLSSSDVRVQLMRDMFNEYPHLAIGGPSNNWLKTSIEANKGIALHRGWKKWNHPTLLLDAMCDQIVMRRAYNVLTQIDAPLYRLSIPHAQHEIFFEKDYIRVLGMRAVEHFISDLSQ